MEHLHGISHGPWKILKSTQVYSDPWMQVQKDDVIRPDGAPGTHSVARIKPGVCVLAYQDDLVYLTEEFHYGVGRVTLEAVSGGRELDEPPLDCAQRELAEELGIVAETWEPLSTIDPFTASVVSPTSLFLATDLTFQKSAPEGTEEIRCICIPLAEAYQSVCSGTISHAPSCIAILQLWIRKKHPE